MNIGDRIKQLRTEKNLTQPQLAELMGIEQSYLSKLENDKSIPSAETFTLILKGLQIDTGRFLEGIDTAIIYSQLRQIPEVALYLNARSAVRVHDIKRWLIGSALACVVGLTLIVTGYKALLFPVLANEYRSNGVLKANEPDELFENADYFIAKNGCSIIAKTQSDSDNCQQLRQDIQARRRQETLMLSSYQGAVIYRTVTDGRRAFIWRGTQFVDPYQTDY